MLWKFLQEWGNMMPGESQHNPTTGVPDPSILTTEQMIRESENKEKLAKSELKGSVNLIREMIKGVRRDLKSAKETRIEQKADIEKARSQLETASKEALAAALAAQKESAKEQTIATQTANDKTEKSVAERMGQLESKFDGNLKPINESQAEIKERLNTIETRLLSAAENRTNSKDNTALIVSAVVVVLMLFQTAILFMR